MVELPEFVGPGLLAKCLDVTATRVRQLAGEGIIPRSERGRYPFADCLVGFARYQRRLAAEPKTSDAADRVRDLRAREIELRTAEKEGKLCASAEAVAAVDEVIGVLRSELTGLPSRFTRDLGERQRLESEIDGILARAAGRLDVAADRLTKGGGAARGGAATDPGRVGQAKPRLPRKRREAGAARS